MAYLYYLITGISIGLGALPLVSNHKKIENIAFFITATFTAFWALSVFQFRLIAPHLIFWSKMSFLGPIVFAYSLLVFCLYYPSHFFSHSQKYIKYLGLPTLILVLLLPTSFIIKEVHTGGIIEYNLGHKFFAIYFIFYMSMAIIIALAALKRSKGLERLKLIYFFTAISFASLGSIPNLFLPMMGIYEYNYLGPLFLPFFIVGNIYAILKHRLMDIRLIIRKTAATILTLIGLAVIYLVLFNVYSKTNVCKAHHNHLLIFSIIYWLLSGSIMQKIRLKIQTTANRAFLKGHYDYEEVMQHICKTLSESYSYEELVKRVSHHLQHEIEVSNILMWINDGAAGNDGDLKLWYPEKPQSPEKDQIEAVLQKTKATNSVSYINETEESVKKILQEAKIEIIIPCCINGKCKGLIGLGEKLSEDAYTAEDLSLFEALSTQIGNAMARIEPFEKVKLEYEKSIEAAEKMSAAVAYVTLTSGISHEIRNPLGMILSGVELIQDKIDNQAEVEYYAEMVKTSILRLESITTTMLKYGTPVSRQQMAQININTLLQEIEVFATGECRKRNIKLQLNGSSVPLIAGHPDSLHQVFMNIILNAMQAITNKGEIIISTTRTKFFTKHNHWTDGVLVEIKDNGHGIPKNQETKIFDPFFTTKYGNAGLGLSLALKIIDAHQGRLDVDSEMGKGTLIRVYLPEGENK